MNQSHQKNLYHKVMTSECFQKEMAALKHIFKDSIWWGSDDGKRLSLITGGGITCARFPKKRFGNSNCERTLLRMAAKAKRDKKFITFDCGEGKFGLCLPIIQGNTIYGYFLMCNSRAEISRELVPLVVNFVEALTREMQKEAELYKLYETIRPRAIALSTIHTVHRVISSTLHLDELLPKLARLCLQVLRIQECCIILKRRNNKSMVVRESGRNEKSKNARAAQRACVILARKMKILSDGKIVMKRNRIFVPLVDEDIIGAICAAHKTDKSAFNEFDREILMALSEQAAVAIKNARLYRDQENVTLGSIKSLAAILNTRIPGAQRVRESLIQAILSTGNRLRMNADDLRYLHYAAILHDAGQVAFSDDLLTKTDRLTGEEYDIIRTHPRKSAAILKHMKFLKPMIPIILHHHENFDGSGYPKGLKGEMIPLGARIMAVAGTFDAMTARRPYRQKVDVRTAAAEIKKNSGAQFDPRVVKAFLETLKEKEINKMMRKGL